MAGYPSPKGPKTLLANCLAIKVTFQGLAELLAVDDVERATQLKKSMKPKIIALFDKILLRKRSIIETINDPLKNISQIEHSRHWSLTNCMINVVVGLLRLFLSGKTPLA